MGRRLIDITDDELLDRIKNIMPDTTYRFEKKPPVTKAYAAEWLGKSTNCIYEWIEKKKIKTTKDGKIPFSELIRLDNAA